MIQYKTSEKTAAGIILASASVLIWGITFVSTKYLLESFSALEILILRFIAAYIGLWIMSPHILQLEKKSQELLFVAAGLCGVTVYQFMENVAISFTSASNVSIIVSICPFFTAVIAQIFLHEKHLSIRFVVGFIVAILGVALVSLNGAVVFHLNPKGDFLALAAAVSWGFYSLFVSKINALGIPTIQATRRMFFWAIVCMIPIAVFGYAVHGGNSASAAVSANAGLNQTAVILDAAVNKMRFANLFNWVNLLFLGLGASAFCFVAWNKACSLLGTVRATIGIYLIPVVTVVFAFFALGEKITIMGICGALLTIFGLVLSEWKNDNNR
jgi:drug/metabolite transporter (DMT)-like permease